MECVMSYVWNNMSKTDMEEKIGPAALEDDEQWGVMDPAITGLD